MKCPLETHDVKANLKNRDWAFKNVGYGPANPDASNGAFWNNKANEWQTEISQAKNMRCGNCAAFIQTPQMMECIRSGIDQEKDSFAQDVVNTAGLGFCELFDFKCADSRTCSAWLVGGPIKHSKIEIHLMQDSTED